METSPQEAAFNLAIKKWQIIDGNFTYDDPSMGIHTELLGINHVGSGDFSQDISDLITNTSIASVGLNYEGINYLKGTTLDGALNMKMDFKASKYSFSENRFKLGTMSIGVKGDVALPSDADMMMDIEFQSRLLKYVY